ncbi:MAG: BlaI/MecI/CopY family transcriptional regulator [Salinivirgaceae bacterium]|nr:BlaI/MecI/CopY family transcriptional regulator [Salinivirgaceae bacterium]
MKKDNKQLTKAELHLMNILWDKGNATVQQMQDLLENPKPAYTTTLTVMQILTKKGIVDFDRVGKAYVYKPVLSREEYIGGFMNDACDNVFGGSMRSFFSFFAKSEKISREELEDILKEMDGNDGESENANS